MIAFEVVGGLLGLGLMAATCWMAIVGLLGVTGFLRLRRCRSCGHLRPTSTVVSSCPYCRSSRLAHHDWQSRLHHNLPSEW